jgi:hypothetical protein
MLASLHMAKTGKPGSIIILCTDGMANLGLGSLDGNISEESKAFYAQLALEAKASGVAISVVTIKGVTCGMEVLGQLVE